MFERRKSDASLARHKWSSFPSVQITDVVTKKDSLDGRAEVYTAYKLQVKDGNSTWTLYKRYSNFLDLHSKLKDNFLEEQLPQLPERRWSIFDLNLLWKETNLTETRRDSLEQYLKTLLADAQFIQCSEVRAFLEPDDLSLSLKKKKGSTEDSDMFLLPPPPASARRIPQIVIISNSPSASPANSPSKISSIEIHLPPSISMPRGILMSEVKPSSRRRESTSSTSPPQPELCHISYLLSSIKDGLEYLDELKVGLKGNASNRLEFLEERQNRVDSTVVTLQREKLVLGQLLKNVEISTNADLKEYFSLCMDKIGKGLDWYLKVEDDLMEQVYVDIIEKQKKGSTDLHPKISKLEEEAENLIIEFLEKSDPDVMSRIAALETKIEGLLKEIDPSKDQVFISRLKNILNYLKPNFETFDFEPPKHKTIDDLD